VVRRNRPGAANSKSILSMTGYSRPISLTSGCALPGRGVVFRGLAWIRSAGGGGIERRKAVVLPSEHLCIHRARRRCNRIRWHTWREFRFFAPRIAEFFEIRSDWYREAKARTAVLEYYRLLRSVRRTEALARHCLIRCRHCRRIARSVVSARAGRRSGDGTFGESTEEAIVNNIDTTPLRRG
jgi:hypothetical protein